MWNVFLVWGLKDAEMNQTLAVWLLLASHALGVGIASVGTDWGVGGSHQRLTVLDYGPQPKCGNYFTLICVRCKSINHVSVVHLAQPFLNYVLWDIKWCIMKKKVLKSSKFKKCWVKIKFLSKRFLKTVNLSIMWGIFYVAFSKFYLIQNPPGHIL